jgi:DNA-binding transcriptional ArsR family regulator
VSDVEVLDDPATAAVALEPTRARVLALLAEPGSATSVGRALGLSRQKVNYHLRALEARGLVREVEHRQRRGLSERVVVASAAGYVIAPAALGAAAADPSRAPDRLSARYLLALAGRVLSEVGALTRGAEASGQRLPTLAIDADVRLATAADRAAFAQDLADAVAGVVARYHDEAAPRGRWHRLVVAAHPRPRQEGTTHDRADAD